MDFREFQSACRFMNYGIVEDTTDTFEPTCRRRDRIPQGASWGKCDEQHCPYFGIKIGPGTIYCEGKEAATFDSGRIVIGADRKEEQSRDRC